METRRIRVTAIVAVGAAAAAALAVAAVAIALGGGGGSTSREDYQRTVVNARDRVDLALERMAKSQSVDELFARLDEAADTVEDTANDLADIGVTEGFEDETDKLVAELHKFSSELAGTAATLRDPTFADVLPALRNLSFKQWDVVNRILTDLDEQGIEVEPLARY